MLYKEGSSPFSCILILLFYIANTALYLLPLCIKPLKRLYSSYTAATTTRVIYSSTSKANSLPNHSSRNHDFRYVVPRAPRGLRQRNSRSSSKSRLTTTPLPAGLHFCRPPSGPSPKTGPTGVGGPLGFRRGPVRSGGFEYRPWKALLGPYPRAPGPTFEAL